MENTQKAPDFREVDAHWRLWKAVWALDAAAGLVGAARDPGAVSGDGLSLLLGLLAGELRGGLEQLEAASTEG